MRQPIAISHQLHPARHGKSLAQLALIKYCLATNQSLAIGTSNVDALYERIKFEYPEAILYVTFVFVILIFAIMK